MGEEGGLNLYVYVENSPVLWIDETGEWYGNSNCGKYKFAINQALKYIRDYGTKCVKTCALDLANRLRDALNTAKIKCGYRGIRCRHKAGYFNPFLRKITICIRNTFMNPDFPSICEVVAHELLHYTYSFTSEPDPDLVKSACCIGK